MTKAQEGKAGASEIYIRIRSPDFRYPSEAWQVGKWLCRGIDAHFKLRIIPVLILMY